MSHNHQKKAAVINDFSGFGRCSLSVALPILSTMGIQCCPVPTALFTNHTGYPSYYCVDFTPHMNHYLEEWGKLELTFSAIETGFLGSAAQVEIVQNFIRKFKTEETVVVIDPVMGDYGRLYPTYTQELAQAMGGLTQYADVMTPNLTELCVLTGTEYQSHVSNGELETMCKRLAEQGPGKIVVSGLELDAKTLGNFVFEREKDSVMVYSEKVGPYRSGTGDVFASILTGCAVQGIPLLESVKRAAAFITKTIRRAVELEIPTTDGLCIEEYLTELAQKK